ncbi:hypothetical protein JW960_03240 [candidate division KSB1 bacterium]|nr:hypothetical protein [candidate division KSB1 bacterium]
MGGGQTIITMAALIMISVAILNINKTLTNCDISLAQNRYRLEALSLMTSYIEQTAQYFFDEASTDTSSEKKLADFTAPNKLGFDVGDNNTPDDFDDFCGYTRADTGRSGVVYKDSFHVEYVKLNGDQIIPSSIREYHKRMSIFITDTYNPPLLYRTENGERVRDTLKVNFVQSYWFYN